MSIFVLPHLEYSYDALLPYIDAKTMEIHLTKHHQAYIDNLNKALSNHPDLQKWSLEQLLQNIDKLPIDIQSTVQNNAGGHYNHTLFWQMMAPKSRVVVGKLYQEIEKQFDSFENFQNIFENAAKSQFGSGWAWLVIDGQGQLQIYSTSNQNAPIMNGDVPVLGLDVWEHAYYLHYQNKRADYIKAWWHVINWGFVEDRYISILSE